MSPHRDGTLAIPIAGWVLLEKEKREQAPALQTKFSTGLTIPGGRVEVKQNPALRGEVTRRMGTTESSPFLKPRSL